MDGVSKVLVHSNDEAAGDEEAGRSFIELDDDGGGDDGGGDDGGGGDGDGHLEDPEYAHHPYKTKHFPSSADHQGVLHRHDDHGYCELKLKMSIHYSKN